MPKQRKVADQNRILFPGNPWPNGHAIKELVWSGRLGTSGTLHFDLHLVSDDYYAGDEPDDRDDDAELGDDDIGDWESKIVWSNFHRCILSSTYWGHQGFLVATQTEPFDFAALDEHVFRIDRLPPPEEPYERAFGIYLLGHDGAADHEIRISRQSDTHTYSLDWRGRIALEYVGDSEFRYTFCAQANSLQFAGIRLPPDVTTEEGVKLASEIARNLGPLKPVSREREQWLVPA